MSREGCGSIYFVKACRLGPLEGGPPKMTKGRTEIFREGPRDPLNFSLEEILHSVVKAQAVVALFVIPLVMH